MSFVAFVRRSLLLFVLLAYFPNNLIAQTTVGIQPFGSYTTGLDQINVGTLNTHVEIPLYSHKGRSSATNAGVRLIYDGGALGLTGYIGPGAQVSNGGWSLAVGPTSAGSILISTTESHASCGTNAYGYSYSYIDQTGFKHFFPGISSYNPCTDSNPQPVPGLPVAASDGSGYLLTAAAGKNVTAATPSGITINSSGYTDTNGNTASNGSTSFLGAPLSSYLTMSGNFLPAQNPLSDPNQPSSGSTILQYQDSNGNTQSITISYKRYPVAIPSSDGSTYYIYSVDSVTFADGSAYHFTYETSATYPGEYTGRLASIQVPTGGTISYQYGETVLQSGRQGVLTSLIRTTSDGSTTYTVNVTSIVNYLVASSNTTVSEPGKTTFYTFVAPFGAAGQAYETSRAIYQGLSTSTTPLESVMRCYNGATGDCTNQAFSIPVTQISDSTSYNNGSSAKRVQMFNAMGLPTELDEYDFGASSPTRKTITAYESLGNNISDRPSSVTIQDGSGNTVSNTLYGYDEYPLSSTSSSLPNHTAISGSRGNVTSIQKWLNTTNTTINTHYEYDDAGQAVASSDANGNWTQFTYDSATDQCVINTKFPTPSNGVNQTTSSVCDPNTGFTTSSTDLNGQVTHYGYDAMLRLTSTSYPDGGSTTTNYSGASLPETITTTVVATPDPSEVSNTVLDGYGRVSQTVAPGGATVNTTYDANGNVYSVSNPYFSTSDTTYGTTYYAYDALGRKTLQTQPDSSTLQWSYSSNVTTSTDEAGNQWQRTSDALGRLTGIVEPGGLQTAYTYDALDNLRSATQTGAAGETPRIRSFIYDSLSRLTSATNPETGTVGYSYYPNGNVQTKTDARGVTTNYNYDALNRLTSKQYSDGTSAACYQYDAPNFGPNMIGRLSEEWTQANQCSGSGAPSSAITAKFSLGYDPLGRSSGNQQCIAGSCDNGSSPYLLKYWYDLAGNPMTLRDPSGTVFTSSYDDAGRVSGVTNTSANATLFSATLYGPVGLLTSTLGNGMNEVRSYDKRNRQLNYTVSSSGTPTGEPPPTGVVGFARNHETGLSGLPQNGILDVQGWAESNAGCPLATVEIDIDSTPIGLAHLGDIVYGPTYTNCGFDFSGAIGNLSAGNHTVNVYGYDFNGNRGLLYNQWSITVSQNAPPSGNVDHAVNVQTQTSSMVSGGLINLEGWAIDSQMNAPVGAVKIWVDDTPIGYATLGLSRPDVAAAFNNQEYLNSGWSFTGTIGDLSPGTHRVGATIYDTGGQETSPASVYPITVSADTSTVNGDINSLNNQTVGSTPLPPNSAITVVGWSAELNTSACATVTRVDLFVDDHFLGTAQVGLPRQDVVDVYGNPNCLNSGWSFSGTLSNIDPGVHFLLARAYDSSGGSVLLNSRPQIMVSSSMPPTSVTSSSPTQYAFSLGFDPNGNVSYSYDSVNGNWAYLYDNLNRLSAAGSAAQNSLAWNYDSFGNLLSQTVTGGSGFAMEHSFRTSSNRTDQDCYDNSGNLILPWGWGCYGPFMYVYDAENRLSSSNWGNITYIYDAEGHRVAKQSGGQTTNVYIYDDDGHNVMELNASAGILRSEVFAGNRHLATYNNGITYTLSDWLGTERARSDMTGTLCQTITSQPFGDGQEINGTCSPSNRFFTGKERDAESGLDYFGARYYSSMMGRFMSPDYSDDPDPVPFADLSNPQTMNLYGYVQNNPMSNSDPDGHMKCLNGQVADACVTTDNPDPVGLQFAFNLVTIANKSAQVISNVAQQFMNVMKTPGGPGCLGNAMLAGGMAGASSGAAIGSVGVAVGGVGEVVTSPGGALIGSGAGAAGAGIAAMSACGGGGGSGGDGSGGNGGGTKQTPKSHPEKFRPIRGTSAKLNTETGEVWVKDPAQHGGEHYEVYRNQRDFQNGIRDHQVWADGSIGRSYR